MKKILCFALLTFTLSFFCLGQGVSPTPDCNKDVKDSRGKMKPWEKGAHETGKYRNVFLEAGYKQVDIDAKLAEAYHDVFEGPTGCISRWAIQWLMFPILKITIVVRKDYHTA